MKRIDLSLILAALLLTAGVFSCSRPADRKIRIGVSQCSSDEWRDQMNEEMEREMLFHDNAQLEIRSADDCNRKQIEDIQYFIDRKVDVIVAAPNEAGAITPVIKKAHDKGIPVIIFDRNILGDSYTSYIELDNEGIGEAAARYAAHLLPHGGQVLEITGLMGSTPAQERHKGFAKVMANHPDIELVASVDGAWNGKRARTVIDSVLARDHTIDLVYAQNDVMAIAAADAVKKAGLRNVRILGTDAAPGLGIKAVADGTIDATFIYPTQGGRVIRQALAIANGEPFKRHEHVSAHSCVDGSNAEIMLHQNELLKEGTQQVKMLKQKNDEMWMADRTKTATLWLVTALALLLAAMLSMLAKWYRQRNKYTETLAEKNRQLTEERDQKEELYRKLDDVTKSQLVFYTNVSHDLRTPLTLISDPVEEVSKAEYLSPEHKILMGIARKNVRIMRRLVNQILDFRKFENDKADLHMSEVNLTGMIKEWTESFLNVAANRHLHIKTEITTGDSTLAVDPEKMERVFFNLMSNALKYTPANGKITVRCHQTADEFVLSVSDTGVGLSEIDKERIFDRFYQSARSKPNGSGIGLSLTKAFIELHGGIITVESKPGEGSVFTVRIPVHHVEGGPITTLPVLTEQDVEAELGLTETVDFKHDNEKPLLLVIDDNPDIRELLRELLSDEYNVIMADNGKSGVKLAAKYVPDLIICDIMMPVMDGMECCSMLKNETATSHIPVLMLTACKMDEQRLESYKCGADSFVSKPFDRQLLKTRCRNLLDNRERVKNLYSRDTARTKEKRAVPTTSNPSRATESEFYQRFLAAVEEHYTESDFSTESMAQLLGLSSAQLTRKLKALTNYTPVELLRNYRLQLVRKQLLSTDKTISEIAYEVGFSSPAYLSKCYRDHFGETPSGLREKVNSIN